jgi:hypothetical protein
MHLKDADEIGHARPITARARADAVRIGRGLVALPDPSQEIDDQLHGMRMSSSLRNGERASARSVPAMPHLRPSNAVSFAIAFRFFRNARECWISMRCPRLTDEF